VQLLNTWDCEAGVSETGLLVAVLSEVGKTCEHVGVCRPGDMYGLGVTRGHGRPGDMDGLGVTRGHERPGDMYGLGVTICLLAPSAGLRTCG